MASPGDLVAVIAKSLGVPPVTVAQHNRALAEAGLRSKGGRGLSAAKMTADDAAVLLIATVASLAVKNSVDTVNLYGSMLSKTETGEPAQQGWRLPDFPIPELQMLPTEHSCRDAIGALVQAATRQPFGGDRDDSLIANVTITFLAPRPECTVIVSKMIGGEYTREGKTYSFTLVDKSSEDIKRVFSKLDHLGDLFQQRIFSQKTLDAVGKVLRER